MSKGVLPAIIDYATEKLARETTPGRFVDVADSEVLQIVEDSRKYRTLTDTAAATLKARLSEYVRLVKAGETILVTDRDEVVAGYSSDGGRFAGHPERVVGAAASREHPVGYREGFAVHDGLDRHASRDLAEQRDLRCAGGSARGEDLDGARLVVGTLDIALSLQVAQVLMHRGE